VASRNVVVLPRWAVVAAAAVVAASLAVALAALLLMVWVINSH
jgi:hypothetical protein